MLPFKSFTGINNVSSSERLAPTELATATNVDVDLTGALTRREGYARISTDAHTNLHQGDGFLLATVGLNGDLTAIVGETGTLVYPSLGHDRTWFCNLPDGRTVFTNGLISGVTAGAAATAWGVPIPASTGALTEVAGSLFAGEYRYQLTYVRLADGREGAPAYTAPVALTEGGIFLSGLPVLAGYKINVYLTSHNDGGAYLAGSTTNGLFTFTGANDALVLPCRTDHLDAPPAGILPTLWRSRVLLAVGNVMYASRPNQWELFDLRRDFKQFDAPITALAAVDGGVFVGTETELAFLAGVEFDKLNYRRVVAGGTVLGSTVPVRGEHIKQGEGRPRQGDAVVCIADRRIIGGFSDGSVVRLSEGRYETAVTEVHASFRMNDGTPQYIAIPQ